MARTKGSKNKNTGRRFKSYEGRYPEGKHVRLTKDMLDDPAYRKLSSGAKVLYQYMKLWACGGDTTEYSASLAKPYMSNKAYIRARDELEKSGFIDFVNRFAARDRSDKAKYKFSDRWHTNPPE